MVSTDAHNVASVQRYAPTASDIKAAVKLAEEVVKYRDEAHRLEDELEEAYASAARLRHRLLSAVSTALWVAPVALMIGVMG